MLYKYYRFPDSESFESAFSSLSEKQKSETSDLGLLLNETGEVLEGYHVTAAWGDNVEPTSFLPFSADPEEAPVWFADIPRSGPEYVPGIPESVSLRQLLFALVSTGWITEEEAMAAAKTGDFPASFEPLLASMTTAEAFTVRLTWAAMYSADRASPIWDVLVASGAATESDIDQVFILASQS